MKIKSGIIKTNDIEEAAYNIVQAVRESTQGTMVPFAFEAVVAEVASLIKEVDKISKPFLDVGSALWKLIRAWKVRMNDARFLLSEVSVALLAEATRELEDVLQSEKIKDFDYRPTMISDNLSEQRMLVKDPYKDSWPVSSNKHLGSSLDSLFVETGELNEVNNRTFAKLSDKIIEQNGIINTLQDTLNHYEMEIRCYHSRIKELEATERELIQEIDELEKKNNSKQLEFSFMKE